MEAGGGSDGTPGDVICNGRGGIFEVYLSGTTCP